MHVRIKCKFNYNIIKLSYFNIYKSKNKNISIIILYNLCILNS